MRTHTLRPDGTRSCSPASRRPPGRSRLRRQSLPADQPPVTFKVEVNYVEIDAIVTDQQGNFVRNLTKDDFVVTEQGKPQTRLDRVARRHPGREVRSAALQDQADRARRPQQPQGVQRPGVRASCSTIRTRALRARARVKLAARQFIERYMGANDVAAIVQTGGAKSTSQEFTSSHERLLRAVNNFMGQKERSATLERIDEYYRTLGTGRRPGGRAIRTKPIRVYKARTTYSVLKNVADYMAGIRGRRKAVVFFSEGIDYDIYDPIANTYASDIRQYGQDAIAAATRANVSFYGDRSARPGRLRRRGGDCIAPERPVAQPRVAGAAARAADLAGQPAHACRTRPAGSPPSTPTISRRASSGSSGTTAATTCSATTRTTASATDGFRNLTVRVKQPGPAGARAQGLRRAQGPPARRNAAARRDCRVGRDARSARQSRAGHRACRSSAFAAPMMGAKPESIGARRRRSRRPGAQVQAGRPALCQQHRSGDSGDGRGRQGQGRCEGHRRAQAAAGNLRRGAEKRHAADAPAGASARDAISCASARARATAAWSAR